MIPCHRRKTHQPIMAAPVPASDGSGVSAPRRVLEEGWAASPWFWSHSPVRCVMFKIGKAWAVMSSGARSRAAFACLRSFASLFPATRVQLGDAPRRHSPASGPEALAVDQIGIGLLRSVEKLRPLSMGKEPVSAGLIG